MGVKIWRWRCRNTCETNAILGSLHSTQLMHICSGICPSRMFLLTHDTVVLNACHDERRTLQDQELTLLPDASQEIADACRVLVLNY